MGWRKWVMPRSFPPSLAASWLPWVSSFLSPCPSALILPLCHRLKHIEPKRPKLWAKVTLSNQNFLETCVTWRKTSEPWGYSLEAGRNQGLGYALG